MTMVKLILPIIMVIYFLVIYLKNKNKLEFFTFLFISISPYMSSNFSHPLYRPLLQVIVILGFIKLLLLFINRKKLITINKYELLFFIVILMSGVSASFNDLFLLGMLNFTYILVGLILVRSNIDIETIPIYFNSIKFNGFIFSILACIEYIIFNHRTEVVFSNSNYLGFYLIFALILYLYTEKNNKLFFNRYIIIIIFILGVMSTNSGAALIGLFFILIIKLNIKIKTLYRLLPLGIFSVITIFFIFRNYLLNTVSGLLDESNAQRIGVWSIAIDGFKENPIFGVGYNNFSQYFMENKYNYYDFTFLSAFFQYDYFVTHNDFLRILTELGILGFIIMILYVKNLINVSLSIKEVHNRKMCLSLILIVIVFIFTHNNINAFDTWWILGISLYFIKNKFLFKLS